MAIKTKYKNTKTFGTWEHDEAGLPCFRANLEEKLAVDYPFHHLLSTGRLGALADRWGNLRLFTTEGGYTAITGKGSRTRSGLYAMLEHDGELFSLLHGELTQQTGTRYGLGYAEYTGKLLSGNLHLGVKQVFVAKPDKRTGMTAHFEIRNLGPKCLKTRLFLRSDVDFSDETSPRYGKGWAARPLANRELGEWVLASSSEWRGDAPVKTSLRLTRSLTLKPGETARLTGYAGYGPKIETAEIRTQLGEAMAQTARELWKTRLERVLDLDVKPAWMKDECVWTMGQLLSFVCRDSSVQEDFINIGGYCWDWCATREAGQIAIATAQFDDAVARSLLIWLAKLQKADGSLFRGHSFRKERDIHEPNRVSDNEIWFVMGCCEYAILTGDWDFLDTRISFWNGHTETLWVHIKRAYRHVMESIGTGAHGLVRILDGDWNDYISEIGRAGKGESVMNSGMACRAWSSLVICAQKRSESAFAEEVAGSLRRLRKAVGDAFDRGWFIRAYTDAGETVGGRPEDRLFINAQSWAVLGRCGTPAQRRRALHNALAKCHTRIGLALMSRPYSCPAPTEITTVVIPRGEGENAGVWPQTAYWMVWALVEEGLLDEALDEWKNASLRQHSRSFPQVPFGIFNAPDCYSSVHAGAREGWTQTQQFDRVSGGPMQPAVTWQAFAMLKILRAKGKLK